MKVKILPKLLAFLVLVAGVVFGIKALMQSGVIPRPSILKTVVPLKADLQTGQVLGASVNVKQRDIPSLNVPSSRVDGEPIRGEIWAWNSHFGMLFAIGGKQTAKGSLMEKRGVNLVLTRQDDSNQMMNDLVAFAQDNSKGVHFVTIMGDGAAAFLQAINPRLAKIGQKAVIVGSFGYSRGEDKLMGPQAWKDDPKKMIGGVVSGVLRDGDWNISMIFQQQNELPNNPDEHVYDPNAVNWVAANDYIDAAQKYVSNFCEERPVKNMPGKKANVCVQGVVTWTPGDVIVAKQRGGLVSILSTKENMFQMPNVIIMIDSWAKSHQTAVENMLAAAFEGGDQVKAFPEAQEFASQVAAKVWGEKATSADEKDPAYWLRYYRGVRERDKQGVTVDLGGSSANNLADNLQLFGISQGSGNIMKATYTTFGNIVVQQYKTLVPEYPPYDSIVDTRYIQSLMSRMESQTGAEKVTYSASDSIKDVIGHKNWSINFQTGSASFDPRAMDTLAQLRDTIMLTKSIVQIHGHTDNTGTPDGNMALSRARAAAVKAWLQRESPENFPDARVRVFAHGQEEPLVPNSSASNMSKNRRVEIVLGSVN